MIRFKNYLSRLTNSNFVKDSFWALVGNVIAKSMALAGSIIVARILGKEVFGEFGTVKGTLVNIAIFSTFGLGYTATKYVAEFKNKKPEILRDLSKQAFKISLITSGIMSVLLFVTAEYLSETLFQASHLASSFRLMSIWIIFNALTTTQIGVLSGLNKFKEMAKINTLVGAFAFVSSIILAYYFFLDGALISLVLTQALNFVLNYRLLSKLLPVSSEKLDRTFVKKIVNFSIPVALQEGTYALSAWFILILLIQFGGYGEVGLYSAATQWSAVILFVPGILRNVILTHMSTHLDNKKIHEIVLKRTLIINFISTIVPGFIVWLMIPLILSAYGDSFEGLRLVLLTVVFNTVFISLSNVFAQAYMSKSRNWLMYFIRLARDIFIILTFVLLSQYYSEAALNLALSILMINFIFLMVMSLTYYKVIR